MPSTDQAVSLANATPSGGPITHWRCLDVLRGIAVLSVILYHGLRPAGLHKSIGWQQLFDGKWDIFALFYPCTLGWWGVSLFFVISGFCIHHGFLHARRWTWPSFLARRFWRIYPPYLLALLVFISVSDGWRNKHAGDWWRLVSHFLLVFDFHPRTFSSYNGSFWSIAVEFQLYLLYPALLAIRSRIGIYRTVFGLLCLATGLRLGLIIWGPPSTGKWWDVLRTSPLIYWFDWGLGALLAENMMTGRKFFSRWPISLLLGAFVVSTWHPQSFPWSFTLASFISVVLMERCILLEKAGWPALDGVWLRALSGAGVVSYSLYLWHQPIVNRLGPWLHGKFANPAISYAVLIFGFVPILLLLATVSYRFLEIPSIQLGRRRAFQSSPTVNPVEPSAG